MKNSMEIINTDVKVEWLKHLEKVCLAFSLFYYS